MRPFEQGTIVATWRAHYNDLCPFTFIRIPLPRSNPLPILSVALLGIIVVVASILWLKMHPVIGLVLGSLIILFLSPNETAVAQRLASGIADVFEKIGLPIVFASVVGGCLLESGSATKIVQSIVGVFGIRRLAPALSVSGFLMAIPVYFDTVFYASSATCKGHGKGKTQ